MAELPNKAVIPERKRDGTVQAALRQIEKQGFTRPYVQEGRIVIGVGMNFARGQRRIPERQARIYNAE